MKAQEMRRLNVFLTCKLDSPSSRFRSHGCLRCGTGELIVKDLQLKTKSQID